METGNRSRNFTEGQIRFFELVGFGTVFGIVNDHIFAFDVVQAIIAGFGLGFGLGSGNDEHPEV